MVLPENLSNQTFSPVSPNRVPQFFRCDDTEAIPAATVRGDQQRHEAAVAALSGIEDALELGATRQSAGFPKAL